MEDVPEKRSLGTFIATLSTPPVCTDFGITFDFERATGKNTELGSFVQKRIEKREGGLLVHVCDLSAEECKAKGEAGYVHLGRMRVFRRALAEVAASLDVVTQNSGKLALDEQCVPGLEALIRDLRRCAGLMVAEMRKTADGPGMHRRSIGHEGRRDVAPPRCIS